jgi:hypothetical protein
MRQTKNFFQRSKGKNYWMKTLRKREAGRLA